MMRYRLLVLLLFTALASNAQELIIENLNISRVILTNINNYYIEGLEEGPIICVDISLKNTKNDSICLNLSQANIFLSYRFCEMNYSQEIIPFWQQETEVLPPNKSFKFQINKYKLLLGTNILKPLISGGYDYTFEILSIIPTLQITYIDNNFKLISTQIKNVTISEYRYSPIKAKIIDE